MTERTKRKRTVVKSEITDELVELFRRAVVARKAYRKGGMSAEECAACRETIYAFHRAVGHKPWDRDDPLNTDAGGPGSLGAALLAEIKQQDRAAKT